MWNRAWISVLLYPFRRSSIDREQRLDLDRRVQGQRRHADRGAGMDTGGAQHIRDQVGRAVDYFMLFDKVGCGCDEAAQADTAADAAEIAERGLRLGQDIDGAQPGRALSVFQAYCGAKLAFDGDGAV